MKRCAPSFCFLFLLYVLATRSFAEELTLNIDFEKLVSVTDEKFLSLTVDPAALLHGSALSTDFERSIHMARALSPAYVRLGGPGGTFSASQNPREKGRDRNVALSESDWVLAHQWAEKAGLDAIACIAPERISKERRGSSESSDDATEIVSFSDHMGFNASWQLGYECQTRCNASATDLAKQLVNLRQTLNAFPRYSNSIIIGPDVVGYRTRKQRQYLQDYFSIAAPALSAVTWHPDLNSVILDNEGVLIRHDNLDKDKEALFRVLGRFIDKRPLWIAESKPEEYKNLYLGALILTRRLGNAAKLNVDVVMRQPSNLTQPTPDYWAALLHKTLVGREVFDAKTSTGDKSHVYLYCQCTKASSKYEKGSVTIFGVNLTPEDVEIDLRGTEATMLHEYVLSPGFDAPNRMFAESVLLNNESLSLVNNAVPDMKPVILNDPKGLGVNLPSGGIGFWVLPDLKIKSCMESREATAEEQTRSSNRFSQDIGERAEDVKVHVTRSVQDRETARIERKKQRNESRLSRKTDARRELKKLKKFVKAKLDDYNARSSIVEGSNAKDSAKIVDEQFGPRDDTRSKLQEFKDRFSRIADLAKLSETRTAIKDLIDDVVTETVSLISKIQNATSSNSVADHLRSLYDLLTRTNLTELIGDSGLEDKLDQRAKRSKRELYEEVREPSSPKRESLLRKRSRLDDVKERANDRKIKGREDVRREIRPSIVEFGTSDSGENTFYGFFKTEPIEGFPEGDVFFATGDYPRNSDYNYLKHEAGDQESVMNSQKQEPTLDYANAGYVWTKDQDNYHFYEPRNYFGNAKMSNDRMGSAELWEVESYGRQGSGRSNDELDYETMGTGLDEYQTNQDDKDSMKRMTRYYESNIYPHDRNIDYDTPIVRPIKARQVPITRMGSRSKNDRRIDSDYNTYPVSKNSDFSIDDGTTRSRRAKRKSTDLHAILDQEMIKEDDANSKDCKCRVNRHSDPCICRPKRDAPESVESETNTENIPEQETLADPNSDLADLISHDVADIEVFSELGESPMETLELETDSPNSKIERDAASLQSEPNLDLEETLTDTEILEYNPSADYSSESPVNLEDSESDALSTDTPSILDEDDAVPAKMAVRRDGKTFFRDEPGQNEEEKPSTDTLEDPARPASNGRENPAPDSSQVVTKKSEVEKEIEASIGETSSATFDQATLSDKSVTEEPEDDYDNDRAATGSFKRQVEAGVSSETPVDAEEDSGNPKVSSPKDARRNRKRIKSSLRSKSIEVKPWETRLVDRARVLIALRKMLNDKRGRHKDSRLGAANRIQQQQRNRAEQAQRLRDRLRERRQKMLQQYRKSVPEVDETENEERRNLRRREAWEAIKDSDDFRDMVDRQKLAHILMREASREENASGESMEKAHVPVTEIVRARNIRERICNPKSRRNFYDPRLLELSNPHELRQEVVQLRNLYDNEPEARRRFSDDKERNDKSYFALVEDLDSPRIFYYQQPNEQKERVQVLSPDSRSYESLEIIEDSSEEDEEESEELPVDREIYIIDPSKYRGGEPALKLYRSPSKPTRTNPKMTSKSIHEMILELLSSRPHRTRQTIQRKREDKLPSSRDPREDNYENEDVAKLRDLSRNLNTGELLRTLINTLDSRSAGQLFRRLREQDTVDVEKRNFMRSIIDEPGEQSREDASRAADDNELKQIPEGEEKSEERKPSETPDAQTIDQRGSYQDLSAGEETKAEEDDTNHSLEENSKVTTAANVRSRRDTKSRLEKDYEWLQSFLVRKAPREIKKTGQGNYLCLREGPEGTSDEDSSKVFKIEKESEYYKATPVKDTRSKAPKDLRTRLRSMKDGRHDYYNRRVNREFPEHLKILIPSNKEYSSVEADENPILGAKNPRAKLSMNYQDTSDSVENKSESEEGEGRAEYVDGNMSDVLELYNMDEREDESSDRSDESVNLKELLQSEQPEVFMMLPWTKRLDRSRRQTQDQEKVRPLELQHLEEVSSTMIPTHSDVDDVEKRMAEKQPIEKYTQKKDLSRNYMDRWNLGRTSNEDRGLPSFIEGNIPKLRNVVVDSLQKAQNLTGTVELMIENLDEKFNETQTNEQSHSTDSESIGVTQNAFHNAIMNVKKFFMLLSGITHVLRG